MASSCRLQAWRSRHCGDEKEDRFMKKYIVFDNEGRTPDRYTIINRSSGDVFAAGEQGVDAGITGRFCGNCADHRVALYGAGWRQMPLSRRIIDEETNNYVRNAQLDPSWLGKELPHQRCPLNLLLYIDILDNMSCEERRRLALPYIGRETDGVPAKPAMAL